MELTRDIITIIIGRAEEAGIEWEYEKDKSIIPYPYIYGSPLHLRQIFLNIYSNCIKYNRPGGKITTHTDSLGEQDGKCTYRWTISDTGIGMSPDFVDHIFEPFTQEKQDARSYYHGTGLGMTITKELVDRMGGSIAVTSQLGVGSTFVITLPFEIAPSPEQTPDAHFYVFSDDSVYAKNAYPGKEFTVVDWNTGKNSLFDMQLMSCCGHNICANSTFSFWGARLNPSPDKVMIRPSKHKNSQNIVPEEMKKLWDGWVLIDGKGTVI